VCLCAVEGDRIVVFLVIFSFGFAIITASQAGQKLMAQFDPWCIEQGDSGSATNVLGDPFAHQVWASCFPFS
jgi:hypothetical protein